MARSVESLKTLGLKIIAVPVLLSLFVGDGFSQVAEPLMLTLEQSIDMAMERNLGYKRATNSNKAAESDYLSSRADFLPQLSLNLTSPDRTEATTPQFDFDSKLYQWVRTGTSLYRGQVELTQRLPTDGLITFNSYLQHRNQYNTFLDETSRSKEYKSYFFVQLYQPLFQMSYEKYGRDQSELNWGKEKEGLRKAESDLIYNITEAFLNLYQAEEALRISIEQEKLSQRAYEIAVSRKEAGVGDEMDVLATQATLAENRSTTISRRSERRTRGFSFKQLLDLNLDQPVELVAPPENDLPSITLDEALEAARENNTDLRQAVLDRDLQKLNLTYQKKQGGLSAGLYTYYNLDGTDPVLRQSYQDPNKNLRFALGLSLPLYDGSKKKARVSASRIRLDNSEIAHRQAVDQLERDIRAAAADLEDKGLLVEQAAIGLEYNRRLYDRALIRYKIGQIPTYELLQAQVQLAQFSKLQLDARIARRMARARIEQLTQTRWH